jgi:hypothetical protein
MHGVSWPEYRARDLATTAYLGEYAPSGRLSDRYRYPLRYEAPRDCRRFLELASFKASL